MKYTVKCEYYDWESDKEYIIKEIEASSEQEAKDKMREDIAGHKAWEDKDIISINVIKPTKPKSIYSLMADIMHYYVEKGYIKSGEIKSNYDCPTKTEYITLKVKRGK